MLKIAELKRYPYPENLFIEMGNIYQYQDECRTLVYENLDNLAKEILTDSELRVIGYRYKDYMTYAKISEKENIKGYANARRLVGLSVRKLCRKIDYKTLKYQTMSNSKINEIIRENIFIHNIPLSEINVLELDLIGRTRNILFRNGIETIQDLVNYTEDDLHQISLIGNTEINDITNALSHIGLILKDYDMSKNIDKLIYTRPLSEISIKALNIEYVPSYILIRNGINTIDDLIKYTERDLSKLDGMNLFRAIKINKRLNEFGLELKNE